MTAIITGATKGIGKALTLMLAQNGYNIVACARNEQDLALLARELEIYDINVKTIVADLSNKAEVERFIDETISYSSIIDVLVNNVGVFMPGSIFDETEEVFEIQQQTNVNASYLIAKKIGKIMLKRQRGHIFNVCSVASKSPVPNAGSYAVTKAAMLSLNNVLRAELAPHGVKVTALIPGSTLTASWQGTSIDKGKFVQPEDIAQLVQAVLSLSAGANVDEIVITPLNF